MIASDAQEWRQSLPLEKSYSFHSSVYEPCQLCHKKRHENNKLWDSTCEEVHVW